MADNQRRRRYLTISILHIITIMCQGNISLSFFFIIVSTRANFFYHLFLVKFMKRITFIRKEDVQFNLDNRNLPSFFTMNCIRTV